MRSLIIAPQQLYHAIQSQPLVSALVRVRLKGGVDVVAHPDIATVYECMPGVGRIWIAPEVSGNRNVLGLLAMARQLRRERYRRAYVLGEGNRAVLLPWMARIPIRIASQRSGRWPLVTHARPLEPVAGATEPGPLAERFLRLAFEGSQPVPGATNTPVLVRHSLREAASRRRAGLNDAGRLAVLSFEGQGQRSRRWPVRHWSALISAIQHHWPDITVVTIGSQAVRDSATESLALSGVAGRNLCGQQSQADLIALVSQADMVIGLNDELLLLASAFGRPLVSLCGPEASILPARATPRVQVISLNLPCSPCGDAVCRYDDNRCMVDLTPALVIGRLKAMLQRTLGNIR